MDLKVPLRNCHVSDVPCLVPENKGLIITIYDSTSLPHPRTMKDFFVCVLTRLREHIDVNVILLSCSKLSLSCLQCSQETFQALQWIWKKRCQKHGDTNEGYEAWRWCCCWRKRCLWSDRNRGSGCGCTGGIVLWSQFDVQLTVLSLTSIFTSKILIWKIKDAAGA